MEGVAGTVGGREHTGMSDRLWVSLSHVPHVEGTAWVRTPR